MFRVARAVALAGFFAAVVGLITPAPAQPKKIDKKTPSKVQPPSRGGDEKYATVVAEGVGKDEKEAKKAAFRDAVSRVVGTLVDAETLVKNDEVISERILEFSGGFVKTFDLLKSEKTAEGLVRVQIKATVERLQIVSKLSDAKVAVKEVRGEDLLAEKLTKDEAKKNATELLAKLYSDLPKLFKAEVKGTPQLTDVRDGVYVDVVVSADLQGYGAFVKKAAPLLSKMAISKDTALVNDVPSTNPRSKAGPLSRTQGDKFAFINLPVLGQTTPKGYAVWMLTQIDGTGTTMRWNFYWVDADITESLKPITGEARLHVQLSDQDGNLLTEDELPLFVSDTSRNRARTTAIVPKAKGPISRTGGDDQGFPGRSWLMWSHTLREYKVDGERRETATLMIAPIINDLAPSMFAGGSHHHSAQTVIRRKIRLTDDALGKFKQVKASVELHSGLPTSPKR